MPSVTKTEKATIPMLQEVKQTYLQIRGATSKQLVTLNIHFSTMTKNAKLYQLLSNYFISVASTI